MSTPTSIPTTNTSSVVTLTPTLMSPSITITDASLINETAGQTFTAVSTVSTTNISVIIIASQTLLSVSTTDISSVIVMATSPTSASITVVSSFKLSATPASASLSKTSASDTLISTSPT